MSEFQENKKIADKVSYWSIAANVALSIAKLGAGIIGRSQAMISDAVHSASDVFSTVIVIIGMRMSAKEEDEEHRYGHERMECVAANILASVLFATGLMIGYKGIKSILTGEYLTAAAPGRVAIYAAVLSVLVKEVMFHITKNAAKKINSVSLMADAWHHRSDALSSVGSFVGIAASRAGFFLGDPLASLVICLFILKAAVDIYIDSVNKLTDTACDRQTEETIRSCALSVEGVEGVDSLKTRLFGSMIYVDIEISADGSLTLNRAHDIAENVHNEIENLYKNVKHCMVHVNPK